MYSHKLNCARSRYEVEVSYVGSIVWTNGPFQKREYSGFENTRSSFKRFLSAEESVTAEKSSKEHATLLVEMCQQGTRKCTGEFVRGMKQLPQKREFSFVLRHTFRHSHQPHASCWQVLPQLTALMIQHSEPLFS